MFTRPLRVKMYTPSPSVKSAAGKRVLLNAKRLERTDFSEEDQKRMWSKINKRGPDECWPWIGWRDPKGYGRFHKWKTPILANRVMFAIHNGFAREGWMVCHSCDNSGCVNPAHLFEGTVLDNNKDCLKKQRNVSGERHNFAKLTEAQVIGMRRNWSINPRSTWAEIAIEYGISAKMAKFIILRRNWRRVP